MAVTDPATGPGGLHGLLRSDRAHTTLHLVVLLGLTALLAATAAALTFMWLWQQAMHTAGH
jgi:hypothetical protein